MNLEQIEAIIAKNLTITDQRLMDGVIGAVLDAVAAEAAKCGECGKSAAEGWALYCVQCCEDSMVKAAVAEEREACALLCDKRAADYRMGFEEKYEAQACAYDIRARGEV